MPSNDSPDLLERLAEILSYYRGSLLPVSSTPIRMGLRS